MKPYLVCSILLVLIWLVLSACGSPASTPVVNPPGVETSLASTALALAKQTEAANPSTPTPSPTATSTLTPTPQISPSGTTLILREDGTALFTDHRAGIELLIPAGWMPFRVNEKEYYDAFTSEVVAANPPINDRLIQVQDANLDNFRLDAIDIREGHTPDGIISDINVRFYPGDTRTLEQLAEAEGKKKSSFKNYLFLNRGYPKLADGTRVLIIDRTWTQDPSKKLFLRSVFFTLPTGALVLDLYANKDFKDTVLPEFDQVVNSVAAINP